MKLKLNRNIVKLILILLTAILSVSLIFVALRAWERRYDEENMPVIREMEVMMPGASEAAEEEDSPQISRNGKWYSLNKDIETVLLIGLDTFEDELPSGDGVIANNKRSDFLMLLIFDHKNKTSQAVHINRDTMAEIQKAGANFGTETAQLALAHVYGSGGIDSGENTVKAVSSFLYGIPINHFISVTMDAVPAVTDRIGGVSLKLMDDFTMIDPSMKKDTTMLLNGEQALYYVRERQSLEEPTNLRRMERQRQFMEALQETSVKKMQEDKNVFSDVLVAAAPYMVTDCYAEDLDRIGTCILEYENKGIRTIEGEAVKGNKYIEFYADEDALKDLVVELFYAEAEQQ